MRRRYRRNPGVSEEVATLALEGMIDPSATSEKAVEMLRKGGLSPEDRDVLRPMAQSWWESLEAPEMMWELGALSLADYRSSGQPFRVIPWAPFHRTVVSLGLAIVQTIPNVPPDIAQVLLPLAAELRKRGPSQFRREIIKGVVEEAIRLERVVPGHFIYALGAIEDLAKFALAASASDARSVVKFSAAQIAVTTTKNAHARAHGEGCGCMGFTNLDVALKKQLDILADHILRVFPEVPLLGWDTMSLPPHVRTKFLELGRLQRGDSLDQDGNLFTFGGAMPRPTSGFEREHEQNIENNAAFSGVPADKIRLALDHRLSAYARAHAALPSYNEAHVLAKSACVSLGEKRWVAALAYLRSLQKMTKTEGSWVGYALSYSLDQDGNLFTFGGAMYRSNRRRSRRT